MLTLHSFLYLNRLLVDAMRYSPHKVLVPSTEVGFISPPLLFFLVKSPTQDWMEMLSFGSQTALALNLTWPGITQKVTLN